MSTQYPDRHHYHQETPLDQDGYPTHIPAGAQPYPQKSAQPKESYIYEYEQ